MEREGGRANVTLNDPEWLNAAERAAHGAGCATPLEELAADEESLRAIVLTGTDPAFSAGGDLRLMRDTAQPMLEPAAAARPSSGAGSGWSSAAIARLITRTDKTFIAAVDGPAAGVGLAFALACDLILVSDRRSPRASVRAHRPAARGGHQLAAHAAARLPAHLRAVRRRPPPAGRGGGGPGPGQLLPCRGGAAGRPGMVRAHRGAAGTRGGDDEAAAPRTRPT